MAWGKWKSAYTGTNVIAEFNALRAAFKSARAGYRNVLWSTLQQVQVWNVRLRNNEKLQREFLKERKGCNSGSREREPNLKMELMTTITGNTRTGRQRASQYCQVLDLLADEGVVPNKTAKAIKERGGIAKIIASKQPRIGRRQAAETEKDRDAPNLGEARRLTNDPEVLCGVYMRLSDRDRIRELPAGSAFKLDVLRIAQPQADLKTRRLLDLPGAGTDGDDDQEDEEDEI